MWEKVFFGGFYPEPNLTKAEFKIFFGYFKELIICEDFWFSKIEHFRSSKFSKYSVSSLRPY